MTEELKTLQITKQVAPVIEGNFDQVMEQLDAKLENYRGLVVTEDTLAEAKKSQRELAGIRRDIDGLRLSVKKELTKPISDFEDKMKSLVNKVAECEAPIKERIDGFTAQQKKDAEQAIWKQIDHELELAGIREEVAERFTFNPRWTNATITKTEIEDGIRVEIQLLKAYQNLVDTTTESIRGHVEKMNKVFKLVTKLSPDPYIKQVLVHSWDLGKVIDNITDAAEKASETELNAVRKLETEKTELVPEPNGSTPVRTVSVRITTTDEKFKALTVFLRENSISFSIIK